MRNHATQPDRASPARHRGWRLALAKLGLVGLMAFGTPAARAESTPSDASETASISRVLILEQEREKTAAELTDLTSRISLTRESVTALDAEIAALAEDRTKIRAAMIDAAAAQKLIEKDIAATESRIDALAGDGKSVV